MRSRFLVSALSFMDLWVIFTATSKADIALAGSRRFP
jgi:hypothetical protein